MRAGLASAVVVAAVAVTGAQAQLDSCVSEVSVLSWGGLAGCSSLSTSLEPCCGNVIASSVDSSSSGGYGSDGSVDTSSDDGAVCRSAVVESAYCSNANLDCDTFQPNSTHTVSFDLTVEYATETCCEKCKCYGDPLCEAFDGTTDQMIECDGRNFTSCMMQQDICRQQRDHAGNRCKWLKGNDNFPWWTSNLVDGSPCQADYNVSGQLELVLFDAEDLRMWTLIGERGVQTDFYVQLPGDEEPYHISAESCFDYDPRDVGSSSTAAAWTRPTSTSSLPDVWSVSTPIDVEIKWKIGYEALGVYADVVCTKAIGAERSRLDIENITNTQGITGGDGFCFTGVIDQDQASGSNVDNSVALHFKCLSAQLPDLSNTCKALADDTCYPRTVPGWQQYWCETAELEFTQASVGAVTYGDMIETCISDIRAGTEATQSESWITYACQMNSQLPYGSTQQNSYVEECVNLLAEEGWFEWAQTAKYQGIIPHEFVQSDTCVSSIDDFTTIPDDLECAPGMVVETNQDGTWVPVLYFPPDSPPCANATIEANGDDYPALFKYQIRMRQCGLDAKCLVADEGTECKPLMSIDLELVFGGAVCSAGGEDCTSCLRDFSQTPPEICGDTDGVEYTMGSCEECCETNNYVPGQSEQNCRELTLDTPYCDTSDSSMSSYCNQLKRGNANGMLTINLIEPEDGYNSAECCETCSLWGDPFGEAFDGSREKLIICDSRDSTCFSSEEVCNNLVDHAGNPCVWNQTVKDLIGSNRGNIGAYGSPCLADFATSGEAEVVLYTVDEPEYSLSFYTGERSILDQLLLTTPRGSYTLDPVECYGDGEYPGWTTVSGEDISTALNLTFTDSGEDGYGNDERVWAVLEADMGIFFRVTCVNSQAVTTDYVGGYRLNVEHLVDTNLDRSDTGGYCVTSDLRAYGGSYTNNSMAEECEEGDLADDHAACKAFWSGACTPDQIDLGIENWCEVANQDKTVNQCVKSIKKNKPAKTATAWTKAVCTALLPEKMATESNKNFMRRCQELAETDGYYAIVSNFGSAGDRASVSSYCASSVSEYGSRDDVDPCISGISVQYDDGSGEWTEAFFIPANLLPCDGTLEVPASTNKYWPLFIYPIRFEQCDILNEEGACLASENVEATCMSTLGYGLTVTFSHNNRVSCPTVGDT
ncbi:Hypothetical Protein FCC1311_108822 [Hondaea fermentalgiana]|uniref:Uncharacterized protein n=1 Tax=Hondaea fermentalgiana TaxID=2315210 RepID=A0A2R5GUY7_9STRA|nr:Hypothetical Protein FCC1311_108822 [Hondaea fermentalgiana]|eukprot:GBG34660.1 Hypothetical Protein FCC1311_108822 [Hondaea fermentalgiana]